MIFFFEKTNTVTKKLNRIRILLLGVVGQNQHYTAEFGDTTFM
jgi:hypothetical protein